MPEETQTGLYSPTQGEMDTVYEQIKLLDTDQEGVNARQLRAFYPNQSWNYIRGLLEGLRAAGRVDYAMKRPAGAKTLLEYYTWK